MCLPEAIHNFLANQEAEVTAWYCKTCKLPAKVAVAEDKNIEDRCREYTENRNQN